MICPNCGKTINDGDLFCAYCRQRVDSQPTQQPVQPTFQQEQTFQFEQPSVQPTFQEQNFEFEQPQNTMNTYRTGNAQAAYQQTPPAKKQHPAAVFFTTLLVGGALISAFIMFIKPGYMLDKDDDDSSSRKKKSDSSVSVVDKESKEDDSEIVTTVTTAAPDVSEPAEESSLGETETTASETTTTTAAETTPAETTTTTTAPKSAEDIAKEEAAKYSTDEKPSFSEFEWCYGQFGLVRDPPSDVEFLMESGSWTGGWKCMIVYSTSENDEQYIREINNVYIDIEGTDIDMTVKHYIYEIDGESYDDSITANWTLTGQVTNGPFEVVGGERVTMRSFWRQNGHEHAVGDMMLQDGTDAYIAFYR